jgi:hypothetical protein
MSDVRKAVLKSAEKTQQRQRAPKPRVEDRFADVLARVRDDARLDADAYARETEVPEGGE